MIWGRNWKTAPKYGSNAVLAETVVPFRDKNFVTGRYEWSQRDELFADDPALAAQLAMRRRLAWFDVNAYTIGYTRDLGTFHGARDWLGREHLAVRNSGRNQAVLRRATLWA